MEIAVIIFALCTGSLLSALVGLVGSRRKIGFGWAFFISVLFTPLIGILITLLTEELPTGEKKWGCIIPFIILLFVGTLASMGTYFLLLMGL